MSLFAAAPVCAPVTAFQFTEGMLLGQLLAGAAEGFDIGVTPADTLVVSGLQSTEPKERAAALAAAPTDAVLRSAAAYLASLETDAARDPAAGSAYASFERAKALICEARGRATRALADPDLPEDYRRLLLRLHAEQPTLVLGDPAEMLTAGGAAAELTERLMDDTVAVYLRYEGWQTLKSLQGMAALEAVSAALSDLYGPVVAEGFAVGLGREALTCVLTQKWPEGLTAYQGLDPLSLGLEQFKLEGEFVAALPGSKERLRSFWQQLAVQRELYRRAGFSLKDFLQFKVALQNQELSEAERTRLARIHYGASQSSRRGGQAFFLELKSALEYFYARAQAVSLHERPGLKSVYYDVTQALAALALHCGLSTEEIHYAVGADHSALPTAPVGLASVQGQAQELRPSAIPKEVKDCLVAAGMWDHVAEVVDRVVMMPELTSSEFVKSLVGSVPHGRAYFVDRTVVIATVARDQSSGKLTPMPAWQIAALLVHEATHVRWMNRIAEERDKIILMADVPNERAAYATETRYYKRTLAAMRDVLSPEERLMLEQNIFDRETIVYACNLMLGYPLTDLDPDRFEFPEEGALAKFGVADIHAMDLGVYPVRLLALIGQIDFLGFEGRFQLAALREHIGRRLGELTDLYAELGEAIEAKLTAAVTRLKQGQELAPAELARLERQEGFLQSLPARMAELTAHYTQLFGLS